MMVTALMAYTVEKMNALMADSLAEVSVGLNTNTHSHRGEREH